MSTPLDRREFLAASALPAMAAVLRPAAFAGAPRVRASAIHRPADDFLATLAPMMDIAGVPGVGTAVVQDGKVVWQDQRGVMDATTKAPLTAATLWPAASLSKPVFAYAALRLVDEGKLDLDKPLKAYVSDHTPADPRGDMITARHVLSHSSGLRNWRNRVDQPLTPDFEPGARFQYSGEGYYYLLRAVEHITATGFEQFMEERLFNQLGMKSSTYAWRADTAARLVTGHDAGVPVQNGRLNSAPRLVALAEKLGRPFASLRSEEIAAVMASMQPPPSTLPNGMIPNAAASLLTSPAEYGVFLGQLLEGRDREVGPRPETRDLMFKSHTPINRALSWGLGLGQEEHGGQHYAWHWGDNGSWKNFVLVHPLSRSAIVVFTNGSRGLNVARRVMAAATDGEHEAFLWL
jgi:CubicO group peptidase (beta-lactamase class C family)